MMTRSAGRVGACSFEGSGRCEQGVMSETGSVTTHHLNPPPECQIHGHEVGLSSWPTGSFTSLLHLGDGIL